MTTAAPHQTKTKTAANTKDEELLGAVILNMVDSERQTRSGPHKSPKIRNYNIELGYKVYFMWSYNLLVSAIHSNDYYFQGAVEQLVTLLPPDANLVAKCKLERIVRFPRQLSSSVSLQLFR